MRSQVMNHKELYDLAVETLRSGAVFTFVARGGSMVPFIHEGDHLIIAPLAQGAPRIGDVVFFRMPPDMLRVHRIIGRMPNGTFLCRGDAVRGVIEQVPPSEILGRLIALQRRGRTRRLGRGWRLLGRLWHGLWPWSRWAYKVLWRLGRVLHWARAAR